MSDADIINSAKQTLTTVLATMGIELANPEAFNWLLGQVYTENGFGVGPSWTIPNKDNTPDTNPGAPDGPSHNWGAVRAFKPGQPFIWHYDHNQFGKLELVKFARFPSAEAGARAYLGALIRPDINAAVKNVLNDPDATPFDLARAMYTRNEDPSVLKRSETQAYYTGNPGTDQQRIQAYANMIQNGANAVRKALGQAPAAPPAPSSPPPSSGNTGSGGITGSGAALLALAAGAAYLLLRRS